MPASLGDAVGDSLSQPLSCTVNRPRLCDLPRGENSSCRRPLPWVLATVQGYRTRVTRGLSSRMARIGCLPARGHSLRCLSTQGPPRLALGIWQTGTEGLLTFQMCGFLSPPAGGTPWPLGRCHMQPGWGWHFWPSDPFQRWALSSDGWCTHPEFCTTCTGQDPGTSLDKRTQQSQAIS